MLTERRQNILRLIIEDYVASAEPVGSRTLVRKNALGLSPATIRNEMADLEMLGYLEQPHASAGRVPSAKGYRLYVDNLLAPEEMSEKDVSLIEHWYQSKTQRLDEVFRLTAKILSRITRNLSFVLTQAQQDRIFRYMKFLPLDDKRAILVLVTDAGVVENRVFNLPAGIKWEELEQVAEKLSNRLSGVKLTNLDELVLQEVREAIIQNAALYADMIAMLRAPQGDTKQEQLYLGGATHLLNQPEFRDLDKARELLSVIEEERLVRDLLKVQEEDGVLVRIGNENKFSGIQDCSMIQATYRLDGKTVGTLAVLGPTRMEYAKIISVVNFLHHYLKGVVEKSGGH